MRVVITSPQGARTIGRILEDGTFEKKANVKNHLLRCADAWGLQKNIFDYDFTLIRIRAQDEGKIYEISRTEFLKRAFERNLGHGPQLFVARKHFRKTQSAGSRQLSLVGVGS